MIFTVKSRLLLLGFWAIVFSVPTHGENSGFVKVSGTRFKLEGAPYYFSGANFWQGMNLGMADADGGDRARLCRELDRLKSAGMLNLRVMAATEGPDTEPYRMAPALQPAPGVFNESVFQGLDFLLSEMDKRGMRAVMQLNNYWHWSGGMAQYVSWVEASGIPYPPSHPDFTGDWWTFMNYSARFYGNPQCQALFQDAIRAVIARTNTFSGVQYRNDSTIFAWELANEPRLYPQEWIDTTAAFIKSLDGNHLVTVGSEGQMGGDFISTHDGPDIDYATCHIWPQNWGWYNPAVAGTFSGALQNALDYLEGHADMAKRWLDKPLVLEEFGLARDQGSFDPAASVVFRNAFLSNLYDAVSADIAAGGALAGDSLWAWGGEGRPADPAPHWIGDPPHEIPGWYSVYDTDSSTLLVISNHADRLAVLGGDGDRDGLPDDWERAFFGSTLATGGGAGDDADGDGFADRREYLAGTSPVDPLDLLAIRSIQAAPQSGGLQLSWNSVTGRLYTVGIGTNLAAPFVDAGDFVNVKGTGGVMTYTNAIGLPGARFYKIKAGRME